MKRFNSVLFICLSLFVALKIFIPNALADAQKVYKEYLEGKAVIIDVREQDEVTQGMVKGAKWIPLSRLSSHPQQTVEEVKKTAGGKSIYVYCRSGNRSGQFADKLLKYNVKATNIGGFQDLVSQKLPTQSSP